MITGTYPWQYYFDYPPATPFARYIMISPSIGNGVRVVTDYAADTPGFAFVAHAIDNARRTGLQWMVVSMHKNDVATFVKRSEVSTDRGRTFMTMLLDKRVDLILQGHEHGYARSKQLTTNPSTCPVLPVNAFHEECVVDTDNELVKGAGTVIQIISTGGKGMRLVERSDSEHEYFVDNFRDADSETFGFGEFTLTPSDLSFSFVRSAGQAFNDSFHIREPTAAGPRSSAGMRLPSSNGPASRVRLSRARPHATSRFCGPAMP
jgi:hypothetical protein